MSMKLFGWATKTMIAVIVFTLLVTCMMRVERVNAGPFVELGHTVLNSELTTGGVGYRHNKYALSFEITGQGQTDVGLHIRALPVVSAYRVVDPRWCLGSNCFKSAIGIAYTPNQELIGDVNYRLELMIESDYGYGIFARHYSSAGTFENNTGLDSIGIRLVF